jgi:hypothetical protein
MGLGERSGVWGWVLLLPWRGVRSRSCSDDRVIVFHNASYSNMYYHIHTLVLILSDPLTKTPTSPDPLSASSRTIRITNSPSDLYSIIHYTPKEMAEELLETITMNQLESRRRRPKNPKYHSSSPCTGRPDASIYIGTSALFSYSLPADETAFVVVAVLLIIFGRTVHYKIRRNRRAKPTEVEMGEKI